MKKLYKGFASVEFFFLSEDEDVDFDVEKYAMQAVRDACFNKLDSIRVTRPDISLSGWSKDSLVYGADRETTLGEALSRLPEEEE